MSVAFDWTGRYIAAVRKSNPPVLYHIDRESRLAEFREKGYGNKVTRKSVCFAGLRDEVGAVHWPSIIQSIEYNSVNFMKIFLYILLHSTVDLLIQTFSYTIHCTFIGPVWF